MYVSLHQLQNRRFCVTDHYKQFSYNFFVSWFVFFIFFFLHQYYKITIGTSSDNTHKCVSTNKTHRYQLSNSNIISSPVQVQTMDPGPHLHPSLAVQAPPQGRGQPVSSSYVRRMSGPQWTRYSRAWRSWWPLGGRISTRSPWLVWPTR